MRLRRNSVGAEDRLEQAWEACVEILASQEATATEQFALGPEKFSEMLRRTEQVDVPLQQLKAAAERDLARNFAALRAACEVYAPGQSNESCVARMQADKPKGSAVEGAQALLSGLRAFIQEKAIVTIPAPDQAKVAEAPA